MLESFRYDVEENIEKVINVIRKCDPEYASRIDIAKCKKHLLYQYHANFPNRIITGMQKLKNGLLPQSQLDGYINFLDEYPELVRDICLGSPSAVCGKDGIASLISKDVFFIKKIISANGLCYIVTKMHMQVTDNIESMLFASKNIQECYHYFARCLITNQMDFQNGYLLYNESIKKEDLYYDINGSCLNLIAINTKVIDPHIKKEHIKDRKGLYKFVKHNNIGRYKNKEECL